MEKVISIEGMACMHCVNHVQTALAAVPGVQEARVDLDSKSATVRTDGSVTDAALKAAVDGAGFADGPHRPKARGSLPAARAHGAVVI